MSIIINRGQPFYPQEINQTLEKKTAIVEMKQNVDMPKNEFLDEMLQKLQEVRKSHDTQLKFEFHEGLQEYYISLVDSNTQEVIKEIPPKKLLDLYAAIQKNIGIVVDQKI